MCMELKIEKRNAGRYVLSASVDKNLRDAVVARAVKENTSTSEILRACLKACIECEQTNGVHTNQCIAVD